MPRRPTIVFAPGAGAPSSSSWMQAWKQRLATIAQVHEFDYPYMREGRRRPDPLPALIAAHREAMTRAPSDGPVILAGKSMGSRIGCHVSLEDSVQGLVCLGYPLRGMGKAGKLRDAVLVSLRTPVLFVQGTRDALGPLDLFADVRKRMVAKSELVVIEGGDHSLAVTKTALRQAGETQEDVNVRILDAIRAFVGSVV